MMVIYCSSQYRIFVLHCGGYCCCAFYLVVVSRHIVAYRGAQHEYIWVFFVCSNSLSAPYQMIPLLFVSFWILSINVVVCIQKIQIVRKVARPTLSSTYKSFGDCDTITCTTMDGGIPVEIWQLPFNYWVLLSHTIPQFFWYSHLAVLCPCIPFNLYRIKFLTYCRSNVISWIAILVECCHRLIPIALDGHPMDVAVPMPEKNDACNGSIYLIRLTGLVCVCWYCVALLL